MTSVIPQAEALRLYLAMVAGKEPATSYFEIRAKSTTGRGMSQDWIPLREIDRTARSLVNRGQMSDTYLGAAPRTQRAGDLSAIERVWCLWADCDSPGSLARLASFRPLPSVVIRSGSEGHVHAFWPLRAPVPPAWAKRCNLRLALAVGADRNATDAARIMRPAGTFNFKHGPRQPVVCTRLEAEVFDLSQVIGHLADNPSYTTTPRKPRPAAPASHGKILDGLARTVREATVGNRNAACYWAACRVVEHELDPDEACDVLREAALSAGLPEHEVDRTLDSALNQRAVA